MRTILFMDDGHLHTPKLTVLRDDRTLFLWDPVLVSLTLRYSCASV